MAKIENIKKRSGVVARFDRIKLTESISRAILGANVKVENLAEDIVNVLISYLERKYTGEDLVTTQTIDELVEKILLESGYKDVARVYKSFRKVKLSQGRDFSLFKKIVVETGDEINFWSKEKITNALVKEADIPYAVADDISTAVESKVLELGLSKLSTSLIRALVNAELFERGYTYKLKKQLVVGLPKYELGKMVSGDKSSLPISPERLCLLVGEATLHQYALQEIYSSDVADAHLEGKLHIHNLEYPTKLYCVATRAEVIKTNHTPLDSKHLTGLTGNASSRISSSRMLTTDISSNVCFLQDTFSGYIELIHIPTLYKDFGENLYDDGQGLIAQLRNLFDRWEGKKPSLIIHLDLGSWISEQVFSFTEGLVEAVSGNPTRNIFFAFGVSDETFKNEKLQTLVGKVGKSIEKFLPVQFVLNTDFTQSKTGIFAQAVSINLPQIYYRRNSGKGDFFILLEEVLQLVFKAHYEKQVLIEKYGQDFHLREILDGYDKYTYAIGLVGLDETAKLISGDNEVSNKVLENIKDQIVSFITFAVEREKRRSGLCISIEEFSADDASERFSRLDRNVYPESLILFNPRTNKSNYTYGFHIEDKKGIPIDDVIALESRYNYLTSRGVVGIPLNKDILSNIRNLQGCGFRGRLLIER